MFPLTLEYVIMEFENKSMLKGSNGENMDPYIEGPMFL